MAKESRAKGLGDNPLDLAFSCAEFGHHYGRAETSRLAGWDRLMGRSEII